MATRTLKKQPAAKKPPAQKTPTRRTASRSAAADGPVLMMALSWQEGSANYVFPTTLSQRVLGIDPTCPQCPARSCEKGIMLSRAMPEVNLPQSLSPTRAMVFEFDTDALADSWFAVDGPKFDLVKVVGRL